MGALKIFGSPWLTTPTATFPEILNGLLFGWTLWMYQPNLKSVVLPFPEIIGVAKKSGRRGSGMVPSKRALVSSYRPTRITFPLALRVSEILPLLCSSTPLLPTPPLPKFAHVPMGVEDGLWATKSEGAGLWLSVEIVSKISDPCDPDPPTSQTDWQTDGWTTCNRKTAVYAIVHRAVKMLVMLACSKDPKLLTQLKRNFRLLYNSDTSVTLWA